jgi:PEP-CTERM motif
MKHTTSRLARALRLGTRATAPVLAVICLAISTHCYAGLVITPTFDATITGDPNAAAIEGVINQAINNYQTRFSDPINVTINFKEMTTGLGSSNWWYYNISYQQFINALTADASTPDDATALAFLPHGATNPVDGSTHINVKTANLRAIGIFGLNSGLTGGFDGIVGLNTHITDVGSPGTSGQYSLIATTEHEIDEVLGLASALPPNSLIGNDPLPEDLYRYTQGPVGVRTFTNTGDNAYFSIDGGVTDLARFNQGNNSGGDYGDWWSGNGSGNPGPNPPTQVQDAFLFPHRTPVLGVELRALDVIGYNLVPEPGSLTLLALGIVSVALCGRRLMPKKSAPLPPM